MAMILKQSTAVDVLIGPFLDKTDALTAETGESPSVKLSKNGQALGAKNDATTPVHDADGYYNCELDATDTNTVGTLVLTVVGGANALPVRHEFQVVEEDTYDFLYASGAAPDTQVAAIKTETASILADTDDIGVAGAGLSDLGGMSSGMKTEVESECNDALVAQKLDHLIAAADGDDPVDGSIIAHLASKNEDWSTMVPSVDSLEAVRDRGDSAWVTATGFSTHDVADVWASGTRTLTAFSTSLALSIWDVLLSAIVTASSIGKLIKDSVTEARLSELDAGTAGKAANQIDLIKTEADKIAAADAGAGVAGSVIEEIENRATPADLGFPQKNVALSNIEFLAVDSTDHVTPKTGRTFTATRSIDGGAFGAVGGTVAEVANGIYQFDASQADMNADIVTFRFAATDTDDVFITIKTRP